MIGTTFPEGLSPDVIAEAVAWRRHLHTHPELAYNERKTADFIAERLTEFGLVVRRGLGGTGVVGTLTRGTSQRTIAIRADMDALPIHEETQLPHRSRTPGVMHACGHDGHLAMSLAAARICAGIERLDGTVHFLFQPAEEGGAGARQMIADGLFRLFPCDAIYAAHNWPSLPLGTCVALDGAMMAANAVFDIVIRGRGCHGAMPHQGTDPLLAGSQLVCALQSVVSRNTDPLEAAVVSVTQIRAGDTYNVIPHSCLIRGTTRWLNPAVGDTLKERINGLSDSIAAGFGCEVHTEYELRYPATINDSGAARFLRSVAEGSHLKILQCPPSMASEDFAYMLGEVPGCYLWLGAGKSDKYCGLHSPQFDFNDELLPLGVALWVSLVCRSLSRT